MSPVPTYRNILITCEEILTKCTYFSVSRSLTMEKKENNVQSARWRPERMRGDRRREDRLV